VKYDFISSLEASNIKSYEVAVAMKYAAHMRGIYFTSYCSETAILHNDFSHYFICGKAAYFIQVYFENLRSYQFF